MRLEFWSDPSKWPFDGPGLLFLGRAIDRVGRAEFADKWDGEEVVADASQIVPDSWADALFATKRHVNESLAIHFSDYKPGVERWVVVQNAFPNYRKQTIYISAEDWTRGVKLLDAQSRKVASQILRRQAVEQIIAAKFAAGEFLAAARPIRGGELFPVPAAAWHTEMWRQRFDFCQMRLDKPFTPGSCGDRSHSDPYHLIFIEVAGLDAFEVSRAKKASPDAAQGGRGDLTHAIRTRGAPTTFNWPLIKSEFGRLMEYSSALIDGDPTWRTQADIVRALEAYCDRTKDTLGTPSPSSLKARVKDWYEAWSVNRPGIPG